MPRKYDMADNNWIKEDGDFSTVTRGSFETDSFKWVSAILAVLSEMLEFKKRKKFRVTIVCDPETEQIRWEREEIN